VDQKGTKPHIKLGTKSSERLFFHNQVWIYKYVRKTKKQDLSVPTYNNTLQNNIMPLTPCNIQGTENNMKKNPSILTRRPRLPWKRGKFKTTKRKQLTIYSVDVTSADHDGRALRRVPKQNLENNRNTISRTEACTELKPSPNREKLKVGKKIEKRWGKEKGKMRMSKHTAF
jgi:hypothetical protein